jgi:hypothetical protein
VLAPGAGGHSRDLGAGGDDRAEPVAAPAVEEGDRGRGRDGQVPFLAAHGPEVQAGRHVDHQPGFQLAVGDHLPHVRVRGARGDGPIHAADVVAGLVFARFTRLRAGARDQAEVIAVQHTVELAFDRELEGAQRRRQLRVVDLTPLHRWRMNSSRAPRRGICVGHRPLAAPAGCITGGTE